MIEKIASAGIVGCGGAGFPTDRKLDVKGPVEYLIVNAAECEPLLRTDRYIMKHMAPELIETLQRMKRELSAAHCVIAVKIHYEEEIAALRRAIADQGADIEIHGLESFYPAGDEQTIVYEVTGRVVPPAGLPSMVGAVVDNVGTILGIHDALRDIPFTDKYLTVTGEVNHPVILRVPVGTSFSHCLALAGGAKTDSFFAVSGGPMMGKPVPMADFDRQVVTKTTSSILIFSAEGKHARNYEMDVRHMLNQAKSACIQCSFCTQLCPRYLLGHPLRPHMIMRKMAAGQNPDQMLDDPDIRNAALCCECGVCEIYACPMGLRPRTINGMLKQKLGAAGIRYKSDPSVTWKARAEREERKAPSEKVASRAGVHKYYDYTIDELITSVPGRVEIPVRMNIGAPSAPVVAAGDTVAKGQLIAKAPEGALGAAIHASIAGRVEQVGDRIVIVKE